jgi:glycerophosphoryl diester phosphodiesterase
MAVASASAVEIVAHRGASYDAPENTVASEKLGFEQGADAGETDVYLTTDHKIMVMHDYTAQRTAGLTNYMSKSTSTELRKGRPGQWGKWKGQGFDEPIPFLSELFAVMPPGKKMFVEVKCGPEIIPFLKKEFAASGLKKEQLIVISFSFDVVKESKKQMPEYKALFLAGADSKTKKFPPVEELIAKCKAAKIDGLDLNSGFPIDKDFVKKVHDAGMSIYTWTVDDPALARQEAEAGVDGITTNRPKFLREQLNLTASK